MSAPTPGQRTTLPVLMYHSIPSERPATGLEVPLQDFLGQVEALRDAGATLVGLTEALRLKELDPQAFVVAMTFDDGYADVRDACKALAGIAARATVYPFVSAVGTGRDSLRTGGYLSWEELARLNADGIEIGSHSMTHRPVDILPSSALQDEVLGSKLAIESHLGVTVTSFCYPHGYSSGRVRHTLASVGYTNACVVGRRVAELPVDLFAIPRIQARAGETGERFLTRVRHGEAGAVPAVKRALHPPWRGVRRAVHVTTGKVWT